MNKDFIGIGYFPLVKQTDTYTCGPVCLRMFMNYLELYPRLPVGEIARLSGTNPRTGTTEVELTKGFELFGLSAQFSQKGGVEHLKEVLGKGNVVFLRTLLPGNRFQPEGFKHWVILHGHQDGKFYGACPGAGRITWSEQFTEKVWSARGWDHFISSLDRSHHPRAIAMDRAKKIAEWKPVHCMSLQEFLGKAHVIPDNKLSDYHREAIKHAADSIGWMAESNRGEEINYPQAPQWVFKKVERNGSTWDMVVLERSTNQLAGGISSGLRWVSPRFRRQGLGAEMVLVAYSDPEISFLNPSSYSEAGHGSRVAAYRLAQQRAGISPIPGDGSDLDFTNDQTKDKKQNPLQYSLFKN